MISTRRKRSIILGPVTAIASIQPPADADQQLDIARRAVEVGHSEEKPAPIAFMKWARSIGVEFHPDWWDAVLNEEAPTKGESRGASRPRPSWT